MIHVACSFVSRCIHLQLKATYLLTYLYNFLNQYRDPDRLRIPMDSMSHAHSSKN